MPIKVSVPYNFAPLNSRVFFPYWADFVNKDIPFKHGISGQLQLQIKAESPIFIRKFYEQGDQFLTDEKTKEKISLESCHIKNGDKKDYFIPGSSLKNMLSSVLEVLSFAKLKTNLNERKISFRDMQNLDLYTVARDSKHLRIGWLIKRETKIELVDIGKLGSLRNGDNSYSLSHNKPPLKEFNGFNELSINEKYQVFDAIYEGSAADQPFEDKEIAVFTNSIKGKKNEFLFPYPSKDYKTIPVTNENFNTFITAYKDDISWQFWKPQFDKSRYVPVFFRKDANSGELIDFGLTVLYKMLYEKSIVDLICKNQNLSKGDYNNKIDLPECLFGHSLENKPSLAGRIHIGHAFSENAKASSTEHAYILGTPNYSFYPFYIKQNTEQFNQVKKYQTLADIDNNSQISGRKRYPIHNKFSPQKIAPIYEEEPKKEMYSRFFPLEYGTVFSTTITYHNLLPVELGALVSAITFHNQPNCYHNIGLAKPYGFGKVKLEIADMNDNKKYVALFEQLMSDWNNNWLKEASIFELIAMAKNSDKQDSSKLQYLKLENHAKIKREKKALPLYSKLMDIKPEIESQLFDGLPENLRKSMTDLEIFEKLENQDSDLISAKITSISPLYCKCSLNGVIKELEAQIDDSFEEQLYENDLVLVKVVNANNKKQLIIKSKVV